MYIFMFCVIMILFICFQDVASSNIPITSVSPAAVSIPVRAINAEPSRDPHRLDSRQSQPSLVFAVWVVLN